MKERAEEYYVKDLVIDDEYDIISASSTIEHAAKKMKEKNVPDLVVINEKNNDVLGVITDFDIVTDVIAEEKDPKKENVTTAMYRIEPVKLNTTVKEAFEKMKKLNVSVVPVVDENKKLLGVVTLMDCWGYIQQETEDSIGWIPVENPKVAEFWFAAIASIFAFIFAIVFPLIGITGYYYGETENLTQFFNLISLRGRELTFYLLEAHSNELFFSYFDIAKMKGTPWIIVIISAFTLIVFGILGTFSLFYAAFSDAKKVRTSKWTRQILPTLAIASILLQWFTISLALPLTIVHIDLLGLTLSMIAILLIVLAMKRDYIFIQKKISKKEEKLS